MGWNTGIIIRNDHVANIYHQPDVFVENMKAAMYQFNNLPVLDERRPVDIPIGSSVNAASVFHQAHADMVGIYSHSET